jgi:hypothetical protein
MGKVRRGGRIAAEPVDGRCVRIEHQPKQQALGDQRPDPLQHHGLPDS